MRTLKGHGRGGSTLTIVTATLLGQISVNAMYVQLYVVVKYFSLPKMKKGNDFNLQKHNFIFVLAFLELMLLQLNNNVDPNHKCTSNLQIVLNCENYLCFVGKGAGQLGRGHGIYSLTQIFH